MAIFLVLLLGGLALSMIDFSDDSDNGSSDDDDRGERIEGSDDHEDIVGTTGDDSIFAEGGDDLITPLAGDDLVRGGAGDDIIFDDSGSTRSDLDAPSDMDRFFGGSGNDAIYGNTGFNEVFGGTGNDTVSGTEWLEHNDPDYQALYDDIPSTPDTLSGGAGNDVLYGDDGDQMTGGEGWDIFARVVFDADDEIVTITDYEPGEPIELISVNGAAFDADEGDFPETTYRQDGDDVVVGVDGLDLLRLQDALVAEVRGNVTLIDETTQTTALR